MWKTIYLTSSGIGKFKEYWWKADDESFRTYFFGRRRFNKFLKSWEPRGNFRLIWFDHNLYEEHMAGLWNKSTHESIEWGDIIPVLDIVMNGEYHFKRDIDRRKRKRKSDGELLQVVPIIARRPKIVLKQQE